MRLPERFRIGPVIVTMSRASWYGLGVGMGIGGSAAVLLWLLLEVI